jgi:hypothetical protein
VRRRAAACILVALLALLAACAQEAAPEEPAGPDPARILAARAALGDPTVEAARAVVAASRAVDAVRHEVARGSEMARAVEGLSSDVAALQDAAASVDAARAKVAEEQTGSDDPVPGAAAVVGRVAATARAAAEDVEREAAALAAAAAHDVALDSAVQRWAEPGSQTQRRAALDALSDELHAALADARALPAVPEECTGLVERRAEWTEVLIRRTDRLAETASSAAGRTHDDLLGSFGRDPYGEDRAVADAADRTCWREHSGVTRAAEEVRGRVEQLEALLNP